MVTNPACSAPIERPYLEYEGTAGIGTPMPISALSDAQVPFDGTELVVLVQKGKTVKTTRAVALAQAAVSLVNNTTGTLALPIGSSYLRITNSSGGALIVTPNAATLEGAIISLKDWGNNAGTFNWSFQGTLDGVVNPTINSVSGGLCTLVYSANGGWGMNP